MNTPAHLVVGLAAFGKPDRPRVTGAALAGSILPDLSLYLMAGWALLVAGIPPRVVFGELYYSDRWQAVFAVDNSLVLWGAGLAAALALRSAPGIALAGAGTLHLALDFLLHHDDARRHFWPLSDWVFASPVSYWDRAHYGNIVGPAEMLLVLGLCLYLLTRFRSLAMRALIVGLAVLELAPGIVWALMF